VVTALFKLDLLLYSAGSKYVNGIAAGHPLRGRCQDGGIYEELCLYILDAAFD
jgi:hypothetical protein